MNTKPTLPIIDLSALSHFDTARAYHEFAHLDLIYPIPIEMSMLQSIPVTVKRPKDGFYLAS